MINKTLQNYFFLKDQGPDFPRFDYASDFIDWDSSSGILSLTMHGPVSGGYLDIGGMKIPASVHGNVLDFDLSGFGLNGTTFRDDTATFVFFQERYLGHWTYSQTAAQSIIVTSAKRLIGDENGVEKTSLYLIKESASHTQTQTILTGVRPQDFSLAESKPDIIMTPKNTNKKIEISAGVNSSIEAGPDTEVWMKLDPYLTDEALGLNLPEENEQGFAQLSHGVFYLQNVNNIWITTNDSVDYHRIYGNKQDNMIVVDAHQTTETVISFRDSRGHDGGDDEVYYIDGYLVAYGWDDSISFEYQDKSSLFVDLNDRSKYFGRYILTDIETGETFENYAHFFRDITGTPNADRVIADMGALTFNGQGGKDYVKGSPQDDLFILPDFEYVDGKEGIDKLITDAYKTQDIFNGQVKNIEILEITNNFNLELHTGQIKRITDQENTLTIEGDSGDMIRLKMMAFKIASAKPDYDLYLNPFTGSDPILLYIDKDVHVSVDLFF